MPSNHPVNLSAMFLSCSGGLSGVQCYLYKVSYSKRGGVLIPCTGSAVLLQPYPLAIGSHKRLKICLTLLLTED